LEASVAWVMVARSFIVQQCVESRFGLACVFFDHVQLRYNVALKFDATFNVIALPLDVGKSFAHLIPRLGVNRAPHRCPRLKKGHGFRR
jgi:hypothetical protein